ncbi:MAG: hypothetical protein A2031_03255 [Deltaproteobacteria bacterium RBG_19FT_COMBO_43_11]|nr:MAG: hypothetical protein A2W27_09120 [Deltaproteobacteria bacterium RBG_16_44_11]OGP87751.1 MAG: hypothetical protein A2031_03255 [Deltaproteobacteria bacterium RBG_19FT_COMBO_43_11]
MSSNTHLPPSANFVGCIVGFLNPPRRTNGASSLPPRYPSEQMVLMIMYLFMNLKAAVVCRPRLFWYF